MLCVTLRYGESLIIGDTVIRLEEKSGNRALFSIDSNLPVRREREPAAKEDDRGAGQAAPDNPWPGVMRHR